MNIQPGTKKLTTTLEEAGLISLLIQRLTTKGGGSVMDTKDMAKELMVDTEDLNAIIEDLANRGLIYLENTDGQGVMQGQAQFCTHWEVQRITITLKAMQKGLPETLGETEGGEEQDGEEQDEA